MREPLRLFWQPGCTSCLRAKEFLRDRGIDFESINIRADAAALPALAALGLRTVPVLFRGQDYTLAQDIDELAEFVGVRLERERLDVPALVAKLESLLFAASTLTASLHPTDAMRRVPQRERTWLELAYHIAMIVEGFLDAAHGGALTYAHYESVPASGQATPAHVTQIQAATIARLQSWRASRDVRESAAQPLLTYFGERPLHVVLERSTWHVAQHVRQLHHLLASLGEREPLDPALFCGLPLPTAVWDREIIVA